MSRKKRGMSHVDGLVRIECPKGHLLGQAVYAPHREHELNLYGQGWTAEQPLDSPLSMSCVECESVGIRMDLRGNWDKLRQLAAQNSEQHNATSAKYVLGG